MKKFYLVGGPKPGPSDEFFQRLGRAGRTPAGWRTCPHTLDDGRALRITDIESQRQIWSQLLHFDGSCEWGQLVEIAERQQ